jgi:hypothetical protein
VPKEKVLNCFDLAVISRHFDQRKLRAGGRPPKQRAQARYRSAVDRPMRGKLRRRA